MTNQNALFVVLFLINAIIAVTALKGGCDLPECGFNVTQLIEYNGYPVDQHYVQTEDGFLLSVQRIPHGVPQTSATNRPPVLLMHGLLDCSATWVFNDPTESLAFILADAGFDVWMGNWRGNEYSNQNIHYNPSQPQFWDWTWDDMAKYDLPALLEYVSNATGYEKVLYVGHSQGTMVPFAAASAYPDKVDRIALFVALAPIAYIGDISAPMLRALVDIDLAQIFEKMGIEQFLPSTALFKKLFPEICDPFPWLCADVICAFAGCDKTNLNNTRYQLYVSIDPAGTSVKSMVHYAQGVSSNKFQMFDFGAAGNQQHYGQSTPPPYPLHNIRIPVALFTGTKDILGDPKDEVRLAAELPAAAIAYQHNEATYAHMDFVWGENANVLIYPAVVQQLKKYAPTQPQ